MSDLRLPDERAVMDRLAGPLEDLAHDALRDLGEAMRAGLLWDAFGAAGQVLDRYAGDLAGLLAEASLASGLAGARRVASRLPASPRSRGEQPPSAVAGQHRAQGAPTGGLSPTQSEQAVAALEALPQSLRALYLDALPPDLAAIAAGELGEPPPPASYLTTAAEGPGVLLPLIEEAARDLQSRRLLSYREARALDEQGRQGALRVAGLLTQQARGKLQDLLVEAVREGQTLREFRVRVEDEMGTGTFLDPAHAETTFRDAVQAGYSAGMDSLLSQPIVGDLFPWEENLPIRDSRLSDLCAVVSRSGIQGTGIYRRDDPTWQRLKPPRHPRCRCGRNPLTVAMAARAGIREAEKWLETGKPPLVPAWVPMPEVALR